MTKDQRRKRVLAAKAWREANREKAAEARRKNWRDNPNPRQQQKAWRFRVKYGITLEEYDRIACQQGHRCAVCYCPATETRKGLVVDHCHKTGKVRGLLCNTCNLALGSLQDDLNRISNLLEYLRRG